LIIYNSFHTVIVEINPIKIIIMCLAIFHIPHACMHVSEPSDQHRVFFQQMKWKSSESDMFTLNKTTFTA